MLIRRQGTIDEMKEALNSIDYKVFINWFEKIKEKQCDLVEWQMEQNYNNYLNFIIDSYRFIAKYPEFISTLAEHRGKRLQGDIEIVALGCTIIDSFLYTEIYPSEFFSDYDDDED